MSISSILDSVTDKIIDSVTENDENKIRYAIVALGDISQEAMMPAVNHTGNSEITAFVTDDPEKAKVLGERYNVENSYKYDQFDQLLSSGKIDAVYLATPNWRHAEFIIPALNAGIHVLTEKPLEVSTDKCREIMAAATQSSAKLMVAYRLHFEPSTLALIQKIRSGDLGELRMFTATFSQMVDPANHRAKNGVLAGPLFDMGPYPINACRYAFGEEPTEVVSAISIRHADSQLGDVDDTVAVTLRFPNDKIAMFTVSYAANSVDNYVVVGTKGSVMMTPGFGFGKAFEQQITIADKKSHETFAATDQFGGELRYFSDCIQKNRYPEPDAEEGYADIRVIEGILEAAKTGKSVTLPEFTRSRRIDPEEQKQTLSKNSPPSSLVNAAHPTAGQ